MCGAKDMWQSTSDNGRRVTIDERRAMIVEEVNRRSSIQVADICERFGVSEVTARNDMAGRSLFRAPSPSPIPTSA